MIGSTDDETRWDRLAELMEQAAKLPLADRARFVEELAQSDADLSHELSRLLRARDQMGDFLEGPADFAAEHLAGGNAALLQETDPPGRPREGEPADPLIGRTIGSVRIVRRIDRGGMSTVYAGVHTAHGQSLAVKVLRSSRLSASFVRRLQREAGVLARLDHPNIARILDSGSFDLGDGAQPFIVMELIDGLPLHVYCSKHELDLRAKITLLRQIVGGVQHAHERGVLHRDLKPGNVLVTRSSAGEAQAKVLDFGLSRLIDQDAEARSAATRITGSQEIIGTLRYMSPEQLEGDATVRSDIHAIGVMGFELITGELPYPRARSRSHADPRADHTDAGDLELLQLIPQPRRQRLSGVDPKIDTRLSAIFAAAVHHDPAQRYRSASLFGDDLLAWLEGRPVSVRPPSRWQELQALAQRHRTVTIAAALCAALLVAGTAATTLQSMRFRHAQILAETRFSDVRALARSVIFELEPAMAQIPGTTRARHLLVDRAIEYLRRLETGAADDPEFTAELADAWERIGEILGHPMYLNLGQVDKSAEAYRRALALRQTLPDADSREERLRRSSLLITLTAVENRPDITDSTIEHPRIAESLAKIDALHREHPDQETSMQLATSLARRAIHHAHLKDTQEMLGFIDRAEALIDFSGDHDQITTEFQLRQLQCLWLMSLACCHHYLAPTRGMEIVDRSLALVDDLEGTDLNRTLLQRFRAALLNVRAQAFVGLKQPAEAVAIYGEAFRVIEANRIADPDDFSTRRTSEVTLSQRVVARLTLADDISVPHETREGEYRAALDDLREVNVRWQYRFERGEFNSVESSTYPALREELFQRAQAGLRALGVDE